MIAVAAQHVVRGLYAVTPDMADTERLLADVALAIEGGARVVQYRNKTAARPLKLEQAVGLSKLCRARGAAFIVNDDIEIARESDAAGVHLGAEDGTLSSAREVLGLTKLIGISCYRSIELARAAQAAGADYVAFGSFFPSRVKPNAVHAPLELLSEAKREIAVPVVAIGGITGENGGALVAAGADALAVITAVFDAVDIAAGAARITALFEPGR